MKKLFLILLLFFTTSLYAGYQVLYPVKTSGEKTIYFALQSIFKSTYSFANTQQEHFIGFVHYGFLNNLDIGITANYHIIDIKTPFSSERKHGIGDPSIYTRWWIFGNEWIDLGLKCDLNIPLGNSAFGAGTFTHNSILLSEFNLKYLIPYFTFGHYTTDSKNGYFRFNIGIQKMIVPQWIILTGVYTEVYQKGGKYIPCYVSIGNIIKFGNSVFRIEYIINTKNFYYERGFFALRFVHNFL